jgi:hypothetical protein
MAIRASACYGYLWKLGVFGAVHALNLNHIKRNVILVCTLTLSDSLTRFHPLHHERRVGDSERSVPQGMPA